MSRSRRFRALVPIVATAAAWSGSALLASPEPGDLWDGLLRRHGLDGGLDYAALSQEQEVLRAYLDSVAGANLSGLDDDDRLAFWINAYNAGVAGFVLERYPDIRSVREVDAFFEKLKYTVAGEEMSLDEVESRARDLGDPRVHFAVVCASTSCPDLRTEAFVGSRLDEQLEDQTRRFLAQSDKGLRFDEEEETLYLSSIFKWYAGDFTGGSTVVAFFARGRVTDWIIEHLPPELAAAVERVDPSVRYLDYDWSLNDR